MSSSRHDSWNSSISDECATPKTLLSHFWEASALVMWHVSIAPVIQFKLPSFLVSLCSFRIVWAAFAAHDRSWPVQPGAVYLYACCDSNYNCEVYPALLIWAPSLVHRGVCVCAVLLFLWRVLFLFSSFVWLLRFGLAWCASGSKHQVELE